MPHAAATLAEWPVEALWQQLEPLWPGLAIEWLPEVDSTNTTLRERARAGDASPCLLVAAHQRAGRGRQGRAWHSLPGASLTFSLALVLTRADLSGLSLAVGLALAEALHPRVGLKWPNDLWLRDGTHAGDAAALPRKLGGILIETVQVGGGRAPRAVVIGVGLNVRPLPAANAAAASDFASGRACMADIAADADAPQVLQTVAAPLLRALVRFERDGFAPCVAAFNARDVLAGRELAALAADGTVAQRGHAHGVAADGAYRLSSADGVVDIRSGELSLRPC